MQSSQTATTVLDAAIRCMPAQLRDIRDQRYGVERLLPYAHFRETSRNDVGAVTRAEDEWYALPPQFVGDRISAPVAEIDVDDGDIEMITCRIKVGVSEIGTGPDDIGTAAFER